MYTANNKVFLGYILKNIEVFVLDSKIWRLRSIFRVFFLDFPFTQGVNPPTQGGRAFAIRVCSMHDIDLELAVTEPAPGGFPIQLKNRDIMVLFKLVKV